MNNADRFAIVAMGISLQLRLTAQGNHIVEMFSLFFFVLSLLAFYYAAFQAEGDS